MGDCSDNQRLRFTLDPCGCIRSRLGSEQLEAGSGSGNSSQGGGLLLVLHLFSGTAAGTFAPKNGCWHFLPWHPPPSWSLRSILLPSIFDLDVAWRSFSLLAVDCDVSRLRAVLCFVRRAHINLRWLELLNPSFYSIHRNRSQVKRH